MPRRAISNRLLILVLAAIVIVSGIILFCGNRLQPEQRAVEIVREGETLARIPLEQVQEAYEFPVISDLGENILLIEPDGVRMLSADCPDKLCVHRGKISDGLLPLVCLPHHLTVRIVGGAAPPYDAVSGL